MLIDTKFYEEVFEEFKLYHPYMIDHVRSVRPRGERGIRVTLDDGTQYDYGSMDSGVRRVVSYSPSNITDITDENCRKSFIYRLSELMSTRGFNQKTLAEYTGLAVGSINKYLNGVSTPSLTAVRKIAYALGCTVDELID